MLVFRKTLRTYQIDDFQIRSRSSLYLEVGDSGGGHIMRAGEEGNNARLFEFIGILLVSW